MQFPEANTIEPNLKKSQEIKKDLEKDLKTLKNKEADNFKPLVKILDEFFYLLKLKEEDYLPLELSADLPEDKWPMDHWKGQKDFWIHEFYFIIVNGYLITRSDLKSSLGRDFSFYRYEKVNIPEKKPSLFKWKKITPPVDMIVLTDLDLRLKSYNWGYSMGEGVIVEWYKNIPEQELLSIYSKVITMYKQELDKKEKALYTEISEVKMINFNEI